MLPVSDENLPAKRRAIVNMTIILLNIIVFLVGISAPYILVPGANSYNDVIESLGLKPANIVAGVALWTLFTSMFLHAGWVHLLGNMLYLYVFGDNIENLMGPVKYLVFYLIAGLGATLFNIFSLLFIPTEALLNTQLTSGMNPWMIPAIGASGAISGVLGVYALTMPFARIRAVTFIGFIPIPLDFPAVVYIGIWFAYQLLLGISTLLTGTLYGVAFWAHIGGFVTGIALFPLFVDKQKLKMYRSWVLYWLYHYY
ncbi:MAG: rhomboid family intramembrane serine protease [Desulfurococcales archaeon]|nr:rhomboid family intramembrane serine protease [Desulfurococcales archaeon]